MRARLLTLGALAVAPQVAARVLTWGQLRPVGGGDFQRADAALVLGARVWEDGRPSTFLRQRVEAGVTLYRRGLVDRVILSGAQKNREGLDEVAAMYRTALALGVPAKDLVTDPDGHDTRASALNARQTVGVESVIVCSQEFHLPRAVWLCRSAGLTAQGAYPPVLAREHTAAGYVRELPATWKAALEISRDYVRR